MRIGCKKKVYSKVISLGIGDTTEPIPEVITSAMAMSDRCYYAAIKKGNCFNMVYFSQLEQTCDMSRLQLVFGSNVTMAVQDPSYPFIMQTGQYLKDAQKYGKIEYMRCSPENGFFPDLSSVSRIDNDSPRSVFEIPGAKEVAIEQDFSRVLSTCFNGASNLSQASGLVCLSPEGLKAMKSLDVIKRIPR
ncbi:hypothetical protein K1719_008563 [Acacia pycnantha]|nr:hypothetical protein K1719_008563 [Acacia pycnantha]